MKCRLVNDIITDNYTERLLAARGVESVTDYLNPSDEFLIDPRLLNNIEKGAELYNKVVEANGKILLIVDSDVDGFTSAAIIYQYTKRLNPEIEIDYWLHSGKQHGLQDHIKKLLEEGHEYDLIILPDSSSNDYDYHEGLKEVHTPCLVIDHHLSDIELSDNAIVINNQLSPGYVNKDLTGAGVVYQFCRYLDMISGRDWADDYVDLAAWGVIGDMGSVLQLENRALIVKGLKNIKNPFFKALIEKQDYSMGGKVNPVSVAFYIVPLVNAMIRVGSMEEKERLFIAFIDGNRLIPCLKRGAKGTMERAAVESARECTNARAHQNKIKEAAVDRLEAKIYKYDLLSNKVLLVRLDEDDDFPAELNGLVAMQLSAKFKKPTIVARLNDEGYVRGSARGLSASELEDFRQFLLGSGYFEYALGHANAFGCSIPNNQLKVFHDYANEQLKDIDFGEDFYDVNFETFASSPSVSAMIKDIANHEGIWGQGNATPLIHVKDIYLNPSDYQVIGKTNDTLKWTVNGVTYIKFHAKDLIEELRSYNSTVKVDVVGEANLNEWMGNITPQIMITGYEIKKGSVVDF